MYLLQYVILLYSITLYYFNKWNIIIMVYNKYVFITVCDIIVLHYLVLL